MAGFETWAWIVALAVGAVWLVLVGVYELGVLIFGE
jgi:hypothetical protein